MKHCENLLPVQLSLAFADSGDLPQFRDGRRSDRADLFERCVMQHDVRGHALFLGRIPAPFTEIFAQLRISLGRWTRRRRCLRSLAHGRPTCSDCHPLGSYAADVASSARIPFRSFAEMSADLTMAAAARFRELSDLVVALP